jgi:hypothetical protein
MEFSDTYLLPHNQEKSEVSEIMAFRPVAISHTHKCKTDITPPSITARQAVTMHFWHEVQATLLSVLTSRPQITLQYLWEKATHNTSNL